MIKIKFGNSYLLRIEPEKELFSEILNFAKEEKIKSGFFVGLGACKRCILGRYNEKTKDYDWQKINKQMEIASYQFDAKELSDLLYLLLIEDFYKFKTCLIILINMIEKPEQFDSRSHPESIEESKEKIQPQRFELKGSKIKINIKICYPEVPIKDIYLPIIDIYLADKHLQIVRNTSWNADYLLIDPKTFDPNNPTKGFKGIRKGESFIVGRDHPWRFEFPNTVSRNHAKIELTKDEELVIEDLNSTNGTVVEIRRYTPQELRIIIEFINFVKQHRQDIERELAFVNNLSDFIYYKFYSANIGEIRYRIDDPAVQELIEDYNNQINDVREKLKEVNLKEDLNKKGLSINIIEKGYWFYVKINGGLPKKAVIGRFYLNLKPEYLIQFFYNAVITFTNEGLHCEMKIPREGRVDDFNRFDKMVIYFHADEEQKVLKVLEKLYEENPEAFNTDISPFTAEVKNSQGEIMSGIGFGEEPLILNTSFGIIRSQILAEVYNEAKKAGLSIDDPRFDFESAFRKACLRYKVDPQNPAFNLRQDSKIFSEIRKRTTM
jgi:hypothetical protein